MCFTVLSENQATETYWNRMKIDFRIKFNLFYIDKKEFEQLALN